MLRGNLLRAAFMYQKGAELSSVTGRCHSWWSLYCHYLVGQTPTTTMATSSSKITIIIPGKQKHTSTFERFPPDEHHTLITHPQKGWGCGPPVLCPWSLWFVLQCVTGVGSPRAGWWVQKGGAPGTLASRHPPPCECAGKVQEALTAGLGGA